jgi:hypothetical protein
MAAMHAADAKAFHAAAKLVKTAQIPVAKLAPILIAKPAPPAKPILCEPIAEETRKKPPKHRRYLYSKKGK